MVTEIPVYPLTEPVQLVLDEIRSRYLQAKRISYKEIRVSLEGKIPRSFDKADVDQALVEPGCERLRLLGLVAIEKNLNCLDKCDEIIIFIRKSILEDVKIQNIDTDRPNLFQHFY